MLLTGEQIRLLSPSTSHPFLVWFWAHIRTASISSGEDGAQGRGTGLAGAVPDGLVCRVGDACEQGHLHGRQSACHFSSGTRRRQVDRRQCGQDGTAESLSEAAAIKAATRQARSEPSHTQKIHKYIHITTLLSLIYC